MGQFNIQEVANKADTMSHIDSGSTYTLLNDTEIQSYEFLILPARESFKYLQCNFHILLYIRADHINICTSCIILFHRSNLLKT